VPSTSLAMARKNAVSECPRVLVIARYYARGILSSLFLLQSRSMRASSNTPAAKKQGTDLPSGLSTVLTLDCIAPID